ncbi:FAD-dependent monooxygenase [Streptomyces ipomoeae]|jgi:2-polyprenyl-6-methoxyphenol hydroxylase-like FAD-dependent oxidoreductase|uniref:Flavin-dependent monooxygenase n=2 Tax=Streptomyces ipomoeae TaxID=103232 RepID=L1KN45_9ACTN|nr:FAD-dependent monooxygenase [Streptomyces ipomoeae]EKX62231.1 FAD binding domain protein [Streptomyces ipomoeae 91-03]MDX2699750.1 FAD-dependent monooxygenase [Streptomyces ipomoeae]MDX2824174.1 FAD-dependent monooxygenase [Streptomyces ipomoeae]MDX2845433.1 FAD-dependent monooxygenase [Streptomyces ipomoeae]MDX2876788.1 FAD-dependent monooxygenase [Streptomyces ipomoeae]
MTIAIVGAGLGGLALARVLHVNGMDAVVYERESSRGARGQGGMLDIHSGQRALREAGLIDQFSAIARGEGQDMRLLEPDGTLLLQEDTPDDAPLDRPEVDRADLRNLLLDSLPEDVVRWGHAFISADNGLLHFADGSSATYDLLVGADGAQSRVRALLTDARPAHIGQNVIEVGIPDIDRTHPDLAAMVGRGNYWVLGNGISLAAQRNGDGRVRIGLSFYNTAEDWFATSGIPFDDPAAARARLIDLLPGWDSRFTALIAACDDTVVPRSITALPVGLTWPSTPGVTLLGDAAHLMPPVGEGANMALLDGALLGLALAAHPDDFPAAVKEYEREMFERTSAAARMSTDIQELLTSPAAAQKMLAFFQPDGI